MISETELWNWFLFGGMLPVQRAKSLLEHWTSHGTSLGSVLSQLPDRAGILGLTADESARLHPVPTSSPPVQALRWDEPEYPGRLRSIPLRIRPALLFFAGDRRLLQRPIIYLAPGNLPEQTIELFQAAIDLFLGEDLLVAAFYGSPQARMLLQELADNEGEALLFMSKSLDAHAQSREEQYLLQQGRLILLTPLPPSTESSSGTEAILRKVATAAASFAVFSELSPELTEAETTLPPNLLLMPDSGSGSGGTPSPNSTVCGDPAEIAEWLIQSTEKSSWRPGETPTAEPVQLESRELTEVELPPDPVKLLNQLERAGNVPEVLRNRLLRRT